MSDYDGLSTTHSGLVYESCESTGLAQSAITLALYWGKWFDSPTFMKAFSSWERERWTLWAMPHPM